MDQERFGRLTGLMMRMGDGDRSAIFELYDEFGLEVARAVRGELRRVGAAWTPLDDVHGLVIDVCIELERVAAAWDPSHGVLPWRWAERRVATVVGRSVGVHADRLDPSALETRALVEASGSDDPDLLALLARLAATDERAALLDEALARVARSRDRKILLEVKVQATMGDRSPAATVGAQMGMKPEAVRQVVKRVLDRLRALVDEDPRFEALGGLALIAA